MLNTASWDPLQVTNYVAEYLDLVESLPFDLQRNVSLMREIDSKYQEILKELDDAYQKHRQEEDPVQRRRLLHCIQRALIRSQELGDEKIQLAGQMVELVENRSRQVDAFAELLEAQHEPHDVPSVTAVVPGKRREEEKHREETPGSVERIASASKRSRRQKNNSNENREMIHNDRDELSREKRAKTSKKKKRSKAKQDREASPADLPIDPNEPTYCLCEQVSYGEMIGCDNDECPIEWFHFSCVGLNHKPKGKWYCPKCRGDTEKTMDKALEKSKKERAYNR
ncbi:inhibitor of growth protein 1 [Ictalurus punctatus]|uniref:Inhibitor of growth protein n=1 Tax=Ictalurus punctatus TaxID=7998 RepID=A0A2D0Q5V9_ICTPU|nr:inhibitor of growth protein 1 [Ictalurus punctatus]XP_053471873.1 inhibitor of growth protein 1-like [Ictalurus furcatus]